MDFQSFINPTEYWARVVIYFQIGLFILWVIFLFVSIFRKLTILSKIKQCEDVGDLQVFILNKNSNPETSQLGAGNVLPVKAATFFDNYCKDKIKPSSSLYSHLKAIFTTGYNESQMSTDALIKNTAARLTSGNLAFRSILSLFIILGLFGTLIGLSESLSHLSSISLGDAEFSSQSLKNGLETLLGKLGGAFAPSIWGVTLTFVGIFGFALYQWLLINPLLQLLEYQTVTNWFPNLVPTPSQRVYEKLRLTEETAHNVEKLISTVQTNTGALAQNIENANVRLSDLDAASQTIAGSCVNLNHFVGIFTENLNAFATRFQTSVDTLAPLSDTLKNLYTEMNQKSDEFQQAVKQTINNSQDFREQIKTEFDRQSQLSEDMLKSLKLYETAYLESRQTTDAKLTETLVAAETALNKLAEQNEEMIRGIVKSVGDPLRSELISELGEVSARTNTKLDEITESSNTKLDEFAQKLEQVLGGVSENVNLVAAKLETIEIPIRNTVESMDASAKRTFQSADSTISFINARNDQWLSELKQEFAEQNTNHQEQINKLVNLNSSIESLTSGMQYLGEKISTIKLTSNGSPNRPIEPMNQPPTTPSDKPGIFTRLFGGNKD